MLNAETKKGYSLISKDIVLAAQMRMDDRVGKADYFSTISQKILTMENFISSFEDYFLISRSRINARWISFPKMLSDILTENDLLILYPNVRYQFNLLKAENFYSDYKKVKVLLKQLLIKAFHLSSNSYNVIIHVDIETNDHESHIRVWSNNDHLSNGDENNLFGTIVNGKALAGPGLIEAAVKKLKGALYFLPTPAAGSTINIVLPDLTKNDHEMSMIGKHQPRMNIDHANSM